MTKDEALDKALNALLWANIEINDWRYDGYGYKPEDQPQIMEAITAIKQALAAPVQEPVANASTWFALVMNAAAEIEDASHSLRDEDAKRVAISGAKHYRDAAKALYTIQPAQQAPVQEPVAILKGIDEHGPVVDWYRHWVTVPIGTKFYTTPPAQPATEESSATQPAPVKQESKHNPLWLATHPDMFTTPPAQPAPVQQKPLFADIIAKHPGLAEELKAMDEAFELGYKAGLAAAQRQWVGLTDEEWQDFSDRYGIILFGRFKEEIEVKLKEKNT
jgi:hypothetical protein